MGGSGSQLKNLKNWWKFGDLEKFICIRYWSTDSVNFKSWPKSDNFWHFWPFLSTTKPLTKLILFFWYTVDLCEHVGIFFKKIQVKDFFDHNHCISPKYTPSSHRSTRLYFCVTPYKSARLIVIFVIIQNSPSDLTIKVRLLSGIMTS